MAATQETEPKTTQNKSIRLDTLQEDFYQRKSRRSPPQTHMHTLCWDSRKSIEARGAARSSMEVSQDRMLAAWSRDATLIPACTPHSQHIIYRFCAVS